MLFIPLFKEGRKNASQKGYKVKGYKVKRYEYDPKEFFMICDWNMI